MPNNRVKTTKSLQSKKGKAVLSKLHPHSRRAKQINRIALREDKLSKNKKDKRKIGDHMTSRYIWFLEAYEQVRRTKEENREQDVSGRLGCSIDEIHQLIERFIHRNSRQIEEENSIRKAKNYLTCRPKSPLQEKLELLLSDERDQYFTNGFVLPDFMNGENVQLMRQWKEEHRCDLSFLRRIRLVRMFKNEPSKVIEEQKGSVVVIDSNNHQDHDQIEDDDESDVQLIEADLE